MILSCIEISKSFGTDQILKNVSFHMEERQKVALVGINGAGKTTLLKIIMHLTKPDAGEVIFAKNAAVGYLSQHQDAFGDKTIYETVLDAKKDILELERSIRRLELEMKHAKPDDLPALMNTYNRMTNRYERENGYAVTSEVTGILKGLGFAEGEFDKKLDTLSGGQKTRVALSRLLITKPDLILLDEPTNHLDLHSITWLENYLKSYDGAVLIVSHDRYFLDRVVSKVVELDGKTASSFEGNYTDYSVKKSELRKAAYRAYMNQQQEIRHQEEVITKLRSFNREKSIRRAESREKMLDKIEKIEKPAFVKDDMNLRLVPQMTSGMDVLHIEGLSKSYGERTLFTDVNIDIRRGQHVAIIGDNGTGKTTLLKIINKLVEADAGKVVPGTNVQIGYYDQEYQVLDGDNTLFDEISETNGALSNTEIRSLLAAFLFAGDDVFKKVSSLSGGEKGRLSLAKLMLSKSNLLILDEPTNHLDIVSKGVLEEALSGYEGTVLFVSHDRYFINQTASRILELENGSFTGYLGNYDYYLEKKAQQAEAAALVSSGKDEKSDSVPPSGEGRMDWEEQKKEQARIRKCAADLARTETRIDELEQRDREIDALLEQTEVATDVSKCAALTKEKAELESELETLYEQWEELGAEE